MVHFRSGILISFFLSFYSISRFFPKHFTKKTKIETLIALKTKSVVDLPEIKGQHRKFRTLVTSYIGKVGSIHFFNIQIRRTDCRVRELKIARSFRFFFQSGIDFISFLLLLRIIENFQTFFLFLFPSSPWVDCTNFYSYEPLTPLKPPTPLRFIYRSRLELFMARRSLRAMEACEKFNSLRRVTIASVKEEPKSGFMTSD